MKNPSAPLTDKQRRWVEEYLIDFNGSAAAVRAGYSAKCARSIAHENTTKPDIQAVLRDRQAAMAKELQITRQGVIKGILEGIELAKVQRVPAVMIRGYSELARLLGFFAPEVKRVELTAGQGALQAKFFAMTDAQLLALMATGA